MLITDKRKLVKKFENVGVGEVIRFADEDSYSGSVYMAIMECHDENGDRANLVCLEDGTLFYATDEEDMEILNTELIIKR